MRAVVVAALVAAISGCRTKERNAEPSREEAREAPAEPEPVPEAPQDRRTPQANKLQRSSKEKQPSPKPDPVPRESSKTRQAAPPPVAPGVIVPSVLALRRLPGVPELRTGTSDEVSDSVAAIEGWGRGSGACVDAARELSSELKTTIERRETGGKAALGEVMSFVAGLQGWLRSGAEAYRHGAKGCREVMIPAATEQVHAVESALADEKDADMQERLRSRLRESVARVDSLTVLAARLRASAELLDESAASLEKHHKLYVLDLDAPRVAGEVPEAVANLESVVTTATRRFRLQAGTAGD